MKSRLKISPSEHADAQLQDSTIETADEFFTQHGALWLEGVFTRDFVQGLADVYTKKYIGLSNTELRERNACVGDQRFMITIDVKGAFNDPDLYASPLLLPILQRLLSQQCRIASFGSVVAYPGAEDQAIHLDHPPLFPSADVCDALPAHAITVVVPLVDVDLEVGTTAIWEGTHRSENRIELVQTLMDKPDYSAAVYPTPRMGDVYMMDYRIIHGGRANQSQINRPILYLVFARPWFRDGFNFGSQESVSISKKQLKKVPKQFRAMFS